MQSVKRLLFKSDDPNGLFTTIDVKNKSILCIKRGILVNSSFWNFSDYDTSNMRIITGTDSIMDKFPGSPSYADYLKDPKDPELVNAEIVEYSKNGFIVVKCTRDVKAHSEILTSFGKVSWLAQFRSQWSKPDTNYLH